MSYDRYEHQQLLNAIEGVTVSGGGSTDVSGVEDRLDDVNTNLTTGNASTSSIDTKLSTTVYGKLTGTIRTTNVTVSGTFPTKLPPGTALASRRDYLVMNISSTTLWVGGSDVTAATGIPVVSGTVFSVPLGAAELYGITTTAGITTSNIRVMEIS